MDDERDANQLREAAVAEALGIQVPALTGLLSRLADAYSVNDWGLPHLGAVQSQRDRAVISDLVICALEGALASTTEMALRATQFQRLLGPNGRPVPTQETTNSEVLEILELDACLTDCVRAFGTALDCLAAASVVLTGTPLPVSRAEGSWFLKHRVQKGYDESDYSGWSKLSAGVQRIGDSPAPGWLAWSLETRNSVVHRGRQIRTWLPKSRNSASKPLVVVSDRERWELLRTVPHMRLQPWLADMFVLNATAEDVRVWAPEPADRTVRYLKSGLVRIVEFVAGSLEPLIARPTPSELPVDVWALESTHSGWRVELARAFRGFEPDYPVPAVDQAVFHPNTAKRALLAGRVNSLQPPDVAGGEGSLEIT